MLVGIHMIQIPSFMSLRKTLKEIKSNALRFWKNENAKTNQRLASGRKGAYKKGYSYKRGNKRGAKIVEWNRLYRNRVDDNRNRRADLPYCSLACKTVIEPLWTNNARGNIHRNSSPTRQPTYLIRGFYPLFLMTQIHTRHIIIAAIAIITSVAVYVDYPLENLIQIYTILVGILAADKGIAVANERKPPKP